MKKIIVTIFLSFCCVQILSAQTFQWAKLAGSDCTAGLNDVEQTAVKICSDSDGNAYFGISIDGNCNIMFGNINANVPPNNKSGSVGAVACYSCEGELQWYKVFFCNSPTTTSWRPLVGLLSLDLIQDTILLVGIGCDAKDTLMVINEHGKIDTIQDEEDYKLFWINCNTQNTIRMQYFKRGPIEVKDNKIYNRYYKTIYTCDLMGELLDSIILDFSTMDTNNRLPTMTWTVCDNKHYVITTSEHRFIIGKDTMPNPHSSFLICFDSSGSVLWYTASERMGNFIDVDGENGIIYIIKRNLALGDCFSAYTTEGILLFNRNVYDIEKTQFTGITTLPHNMVAIGGYASKYETIGGMGNDSIKGAFFLLYDSNVDRFRLFEMVPPRGYFSQFCMDKDDNLLFAGNVGGRSQLIFGNDTIEGRGVTNTFFGKYGWPCGVTAQWPEPVGIADVEAEAMELRVYPNPARSGVWVERRGAPLVVDAAGNVVEGLLEEGPVEGTSAAGSAATSATLTLRNSLGQQLQQHSLPAGTARHYLSLDNLPQGLYLLEYRPQGEAPVIKKVIKQ